MRQPPLSANPFSKLLILANSLEIICVYVFFLLPLLAARRFSREGGGGVCFEAPRGRNLNAHFFYTAPIPGSVFSGMGGGGLSHSKKITGRPNGIADRDKYFRIRYAFHSRCRYRRKLYWNYFL